MQTILGEHCIIHVLVTGAIRALTQRAIDNLLANFTQWHGDVCPHES